MNQTVLQLHGCDERFLARDSFREWTSSQWRKYLKRHRFEYIPYRRAHVRGPSRIGERNHYAGLYALHYFTSLAEFIAYEYFHSSMSQNLIRDKMPDESWFRLDTEANYADRLWRLFISIGSILEDGHAAKWLSSWSLPSDFDWLRPLAIRQAVVNEDTREATMWAETQAGYLLFLVMNG